MSNKQQEKESLDFTQTCSTNHEEVEVDTLSTCIDPLPCKDMTMLTRGVDMPVRWFYKNLEAKK